MSLPLPPVANLTTREAHEFVANRPLFEHLVEKCGLAPIWVGKGNKTVLYRVSAIVHALNILEANGGYDATNTPS